MGTKTKIEGITLRDLVEAEQSLELLCTRPMVGKIAFRLAKVMRKIRPDLKTYHQGITTLIEGCDHLPTERGGIRLDDQSGKFLENRKKLRDHTDSVLAEPVVIEGGVGPVKLDELIEALPKRTEGEGDDAKQLPAFIEPLILADLWWLIEE